MIPQASAYQANNFETYRHQWHHWLPVKTCSKSYLDKWDWRLDTLSHYSAVEHTHTLPAAPPFPDRHSSPRKRIHPQACCSRRRSRTPGRWWCSSPRWLPPRQSTSLWYPGPSCTPSRSRGAAVLQFCRVPHILQSSGRGGPPRWSWQQSGKMRKYITLCVLSEN